VRAGRAVIGWCDNNFFCSSVKAQGCGDDSHSWGFEGFNASLRHDHAASDEDSEDGTTYGFEWAAGDVLGCAIDIDQGEIEYFFNGESLGIAFTLDLTARPLFMPCISFESSIVFSLNIGEAPFRSQPPLGFRSVKHWVRNLQEKQHALASGARFGTLQCTYGSAALIIDGLTLTVTSGFPSATLAGCLLTTGTAFLPVLLFSLSQHSFRSFSLFRRVVDRQMVLRVHCHS